MANADLTHEHAVTKASNEHAVYVKQLQEQAELAKGEMERAKELADTHLAESKAKIAELEVLLTKAKDTAADTTLREQVATLTTQLEAAEARHTTATAAQAELEKTHAAQATQHTQLEETHIALKQTADNLRGELTAVSNELAMAKEASTEQSTRLQAAQVQIASLESNVATRDAAYNRIKELKQEADNKLAEVQAQLDAAAASSQSTIAELQMKLAQATTTADNAKQAQQGVDSALERYKLEVETLKQEEARSKVCELRCQKVS
jgi:chromosome segregation ATPase